MLKAIAEKIFQRHPHEDELEKLRQIAERAERFEQSVIESMQSSYNDSEQQHAHSDQDSDSF
jgi:hypothetical protein